MPACSARGLSHVPPEWVESSGTFFITINCKPRGMDYFTAGDFFGKTLRVGNVSQGPWQMVSELVLLMPWMLRASLWAAAVIPSALPSLPFIRRT